jgi:hypothetical protein
MLSSAMGDYRSGSGEWASALGHSLPDKISILLQVDSNVSAIPNASVSPKVFSLLLEDQLARMLLGRVALLPGCSRRTAGL